MVVKASKRGGEAVEGRGKGRRRAGELDDFFEAEGGGALSCLGDEKV